MLRNLVKVHRASVQVTGRASMSDHVQMLGNGVRVATEQTFAPFACLSLFLRTGPRYEPTCYNGINHFLEHMAFKGFTCLKRWELENFARCTGTRLMAHTSQEYQSFSVMCAPESITQAVKTLCGIMCNLELNPVEFENERVNILLQMEDTDRDYKTIVFENLIQTAFQGTNLGQKVVGPSSNLECFEVKMAQEYINVQYQPHNVVFASSAPVSNCFISALVEENLGCMTATSVGYCSGDTRYTGSSAIYRDDSRDFAHVAVAFEAPGYLSDEALSMLVLKNMVGSWSKTHAVWGAWPELARRCSNTELCHSYESFYLTYQDVGLWGVYFVCRKLEPEDFLHNWQDVLLSLCCYMTTSDFECGKQAVKMDLCRQRAGALNSSLSLGKEILYKGKITSLNAYMNSIDCMHKYDLQNVAYKTLYNKHPVLSAAGPTENVPDYNRLSSGQFWLRW